MPNLFHFVLRRFDPRTEVRQMLGSQPHSQNLEAAGVGYRLHQGGQQSHRHGDRDTPPPITTGHLAVRQREKSRCSSNLVPMPPITTKDLKDVARVEKISKIQNMTLTLTSAVADGLGW